MDIGIIGLYGSGRSTLFNALTHQSGVGIRVGVVQVPDPRLKKLEEMFHPKKNTPAELRYIDVDTPPRRGLGILPDPLRQADAFIAVVRSFSDETIPHPEGSLDPHRDLSTIETELILSDLLLVERRINKIEETISKVRAVDRQHLIRERGLLLRIKAGLERDIPIREQSLSDEDRRILSGYTLLSLKPMLVVVNIGEEDIPWLSQIEGEWRKICRPLREVGVVCAKIEVELSRLSDDEAKEFRRILGLPEEALDRLITQCYHLLGLVSFFTTVSDELRAWSVPKDTPAAKAAGKIHSDIERGFIRAEVIAFDDLIKVGSLAEARRRGLIRHEGKDYPVRDGDIITFLFNV